MAALSRSVTAQFLNSRWAVPLVIGLAIAIRLVWLITTQHDITYVGEPRNVSVAIGTGRGFSDTFFVGSGPTAHLMPTATLISGSIYWLFGVDTIMSRFMLFVVAAAETIALYSLLSVLFAKIGCKKASIFFAILILSFNPDFIRTEGLFFSFHEIGIALILATWCMLDIVNLSSGNVNTISQFQMMRSCLVAAILIFVSPILGLAILTGYLLFVVTKMPWASTVKAGIFTVLFTAILFTPWTIRNHLVLGHPIISRDNAGLELAIANHPRALYAIGKGDDIEGQVFDRQIIDVHPLANGAGRAEFRTMGEVAYARHVGDKAKIWIANHPDGFIRLTLHHWRQMYFPSSWIVGKSLREPRAWFIWIANGLGLAGLAVGLFQRRKGWIYPAIFIGIIGICYAPFQPVLRYLYPIHCLLVFFAVDFVQRLASKLPGATSGNSDEIEGIVPA